MNTLALVTASLVLVAAATGCTATAVDSSPTGESSAIRIDDKSLAAGDTVVVDLTGSNVYEIAVTAAARDRVVVHNAQADRKLPEYLQQLGVSPSIDAKVIRLSGEAKKLTSDVAAPAPEQKLISTGGYAGGGLSFTCSPFSCACTGDVDCNDMFEGGVCGGDAICIDDSCYCFRWGRALR